MLPCHLISAESRRTQRPLSHVPKYRNPQAIGKSLGRSGIVVGAVVRRTRVDIHTDLSPCLVHTVSVRGLVGFDLASDKTITTSMTIVAGPGGNDALNWQLAQFPYDGFVHVALALPEEFGERAMEYRRRTLPALEGLVAQISVADRIVHPEFGTYVRREALALLPLARSVPRSVEPMIAD